MAIEMRMPKLSMAMQHATIMEWLKREGDPVEKDEPLVMVETEKTTTDLTPPASGIVGRIVAPVNAKVEAGDLMAIIVQPGEKSPELEAAAPLVAEEEDPKGLETHRPEAQAPSIMASPAARRLAKKLGVDISKVTPSGRRVSDDDVRAFHEAQKGQVDHSRITTTPIARKLAKTLDVDLSTIKGSGPGGRITRSDVEAAASKPEPAAPAPVEASESTSMSGVRLIIAERMSASDTETARVTLVTEADATLFVQARIQLKESVSEEWGFAPGYNDLLALMVSRALGELPYMNVRLSEDGQTIERLGSINLGMAVDTERGLLVPVVRDADQKELRAFGAEFRALVARARVGRSLPDDLSGGTFTITNLGMYDVDAFTPIINLPEAAILGVGRIQPKPVIRDGQVVARDMWTLSLVFDHRLVDGAPAARFLQRIKNLIENPFQLLGLGQAG